jgi:hypothetical protein
VADASSCDNVLHLLCSSELKTAILRFLGDQADGSQGYVLLPSARSSDSSLRASAVAPPQSQPYFGCDTTLEQQVRRAAGVAGAAAFWFLQALMAGYMGCVLVRASHMPILLRHGARRCRRPRLVLPVCPRQPPPRPPRSSRRPLSSGSRAACAAPSQRGSSVVSAAQTAIPRPLVRGQVQRRAQAARTNMQSASAAPPPPVCACHTSQISQALPIYAPGCGLCIWVACSTVQGDMRETACVHAHAPAELPRNPLMPPSLHTSCASQCALSARVMRAV